MGIGVGRHNDKTTGHDGCGPVPLSDNLSINTFANKKAVALKGSKAAAHGCKNHGSHNPTVSGVSSYTFSHNRGWGLKNSTMSNCADKINEVSPNTFSNF